ncbi:FadR/GntR family transcriptional regulator [Azospira restricta]|uniref:FadR family transcriptional regulator n=1 Tax=Azospira restricta TaxID=404405 RepID=A0A974SNF9_9RHOO|nr:FCD domain-containing protein [Azospira restricta]QRJ63354.1 FadR family transcriptional regulator [Azospira restricta]
MPSVSSIAAQTLQRRILDGQYPAGSALPGQRELSESLGISRASLREAISMLEALGLLRSFAGKGVFVTAGTPTDAADLPSGPNAMPPDAIFQMRFVIEPANAALAARRRDDDGLSALRECMAEMQQALSASDLVSAAECDLRFHLALAELSGNPALAAITQQFHAQLAHSLRLPFADRSQIWQPADEHNAILAAVAAGNAGAARKAMQQHLLSAAGRVGIRFIQP